MRRVLAALMTLYLALAPVYWLPRLDAGWLGWFKIALFLAAVALAAFVALLEGKAALPRGLLGPAGFALLLLAAFGGLAQAEPEEAAAALKDYALTFLGLWVFYLLVRLEVDVERVMIASGLAIAGLCLLTVSSAWVGAPDWTAPSAFDSQHLWECGFGSARTGWSNAVALYVAPLLLPFARRGGSRLRGLAPFGVAAILLSQFVVAGRAGLAASLMILGAALNQPGRRKFLLVAAAAGALVLFGNLEAFKRQMRITAENNAAYSLDEVASGRVELTLAGIEKAFEHPFVGNGVGRAWIGEHEIHNLWIRLAAESGPLVPGLLLLVVLRVLSAARKAARAAPAGPYGAFRERAYLGGIIGGLVITMLEPRMLLGAFQVTALWWAFAGIACRRATANGRAFRPEALRAPLVSA